MNDDIAKERLEPPEPEPVVLGDIRYEALMWGKARDLGQNGGYIEAFKVSTGESLWVLKIYDIVYDDDMEQDKQDIFIEEMRAVDSGHLLILDEHGRRYKVDVRDMSVDEMKN
ncbi:hypothetical protein ACG74X_01655 [Marivita sp. S0852]|uniref:hypothetical protein n=1 Tax=Marivita sp. S0852 TaxID=3373893 RepID=UPI00398262BD